MKWIYTGVIRPKLTYGSLKWGHATKAKITLQKLNKLNRLACLLIAQVPKSTPQMNLEILLDIEPLDIHIKKTVLSAFIRLKSQLDACTWYTEIGISHIQHWRTMAETIVESGNDDRCDEIVCMYVCDGVY